MAQKQRSLCLVNRVSARERSQNVCFGGADMPSSLRETVYSLLQTCSRRKDLISCRDAYSLMILTGLDSISVFCDHLIRLFASSGSLHDAFYVFSHASQPTIYTWNQILSAHISFGQDDRAIELFRRMLHGPIVPDSVTFSIVLKACVNTQNAGMAKSVHSKILMQGIPVDAVLGATLVVFYSKFGTLEESFNSFQCMAHRDMVSWGAMMAGFLHHNDGHSSLACLDCMCSEGLVPNKVILVLGLRACASIGALAQGMVIHDAINRADIVLDSILQNVLIDMYSKCGYLEDAVRMFKRSGFSRDLAIWSAMINGYVKCQRDELAMELYRSMLEGRIEPDHVVLLSVLKACGNVGSFQECSLIHDQIIRLALESNIMIGNSLINTYAKCGSSCEAHKIFCQLTCRDIVSWSAIISGYVQHTEDICALELFLRMLIEGIMPNKCIISCILKACGNLGAFQEGCFIHDVAIKLGLNDDSIICNSLVYLYAKCSCLNEAKNLFQQSLNKNAVSSSALITGYIENEETHTALELLKTSLFEGVTPDKGLLSCSLNVCYNIQELQLGRLIHHSLIITQDKLDSDSEAGLLKMYIGCDALQDAKAMFETLKNPDVAIWNTLISGYREHGFCYQALELFEKMQDYGTQPDEILFLSVISACCDLGAIKKGRVLHSHIVEMCSESDKAIGSSLIHFYIKCASVEDARSVSIAIQNRDLVSWGAMISGYGLHSDRELANVCFQAMQQDGCKPNDVIFTGMFTACNHSGRLEDGCKYFRHMRECYGILPNGKHYDSIIDLFSRAGHLSLAADLIQTIPVPSNVLGQTSLLTGYRIYGNADVSKQSFNHAASMPLGHETEWSAVETKTTTTSRSETLQ